MLGKNVVRIADAPTWQAPEPHVRAMTLMFDRVSTPTENIAAGVVRIPPDHEQPKLSSHLPEEIYLVLAGRGIFVLGDYQVEIEAGTAVYVAPWIQHRAINTGTEDLVLYFVHTPSSSELEDRLHGWEKVR